jgi:hypothetical protein
MRIPAPVAILAVALVGGQGSEKTGLPGTSAYAEDPHRAETQADDLTSARRQAAAQLLAAALKDVPLLPPQVERNYAYCTIAQEQAAAGDIAGALATAGQIAQNKAHPDTFAQTYKLAAYHAIAAAQMRSGDVAGAGQTYAAAKAFIAHLRAGYTRDNAYMQLVGAQCQAGDIAGAKAVAAVIEGINSRGYAYAFIAETQAKADDLPGAKASLSLVGDWSTRFAPSCAVAAAEARAGDIAGAKATAVAIRQKNRTVGAYRAIALAQAQAGDAAGSRESFAIAKRTLAATPDNGSEVGISCGIATDQAKAGQVADAKATLLEQLGKQMGEEQRAMILADLAAIQYRDGDLAGAVATAKKIRLADVKIDCLLGLVAAEVKAGHTGRAREVLDSVKAAAGTSGLALVWISAAELWVGNLEGAKAAAAKLRYQPARGEAYALIAVTQAKAGDIAGAMAIAGQIVDAQQRGLARVRIVAAQAKSGDLAGAERTLAAIPAKDWQGEAAAGIAAAEAAAGNAAAAIQRVTATATSPWQRYMRLVAMAKELCETSPPADSLPRPPRKLSDERD